MKKIIIVLILTGIVIMGIVYFYTKKPTSIIEPIPNEEMMDLTLFLQDKEIAKIRDCGATYKVIRQIPKTTGVLHASLKILFEEELSRYGQYDSVKIKDQVAQVMLKSSTTQSGSPIGSLSSCEVQHLMSVLDDTLTQYPGVFSVELFSPEGKIEF
jgi:hypothetical protein